MDAHAIRSQCRALFVVSSGNGLEPRSAIEGRLHEVAGASRTNLVYSGRLVSDKEVLDLPPILVRLHMFTSSLGLPGPKLEIIGFGPCETALREQFRLEGLYDQLLFHGEVWDDDQIAIIYGRCLAAVAPGYVGLNAVQAIGHGVPVVARSATKLQHAPEFESLVPGRNAMIVQSRDPADFARRTSVRPQRPRTLHRSWSKPSSRCERN